MPAIIVVVTLLFAIAGSLFMAWTIGAGSSGSAPFAPAVGANAISVMRAGFLVGILGFAGAVMQGANVSETIGSGLIRGVTLSPAAVIIGLFTAAILVSVGVFTGYPIATAFTVTGAVTGVGVALGGVPAWGTYQQIVVVWTLIPFVGGSTAYLTARALGARRLPTDTIIALLALLTTLVIVNMQFTIFGPPGKNGSLVTILRAVTVPSGISSTAGHIGISLVLATMSAGVLKHSHNQLAGETEQVFLVTLGGLVAFSAGATQVGLAVGPLLPILDEWAIPTAAVLLLGGVGLLAGSWTGAPRMIKALSQDYSALGPKRSIAALVPSFIIAQSAVFLGIPVSFNEIIVSAIIGSGYTANNAPVSVMKIRNTVLAWVGSLCLSGVCSYSVVLVFT